MAKPKVSIDMKQLDALSRELTKNGYRADKRIHDETQKWVADIYKNVRRTSPRMTRRYAKSWVREVMYDSAIAHFSISNPTEYGVAIEGGVLPGDAPWGKKNNSKPATKRDRTVLSAGRIWSTQAVGGVVNKYITSTRAAAFSRFIGKIAMQELKGGK